MNENSFIYLPELKKGNKIINDYIDDSFKENIEQDIIQNYNIFFIFLEALEKNDENNKKEKLYEDTIALYENEKHFNLLITLFLIIYDKNKNLCSKLIDIFCKINDQDNKDRYKDLNTNLDAFKKIYSNAKDIIEENQYNPVHFYFYFAIYIIMIKLIFQK